MSGTGAPWKILSIKQQPAGPSYIVDPSDGQKFAVNTIKIAGNHVGVNGEVEIECQSYSHDKPEHGAGTLLIDGAKPWVLDPDYAEKGVLD